MRRALAACVAMVGMAAHAGANGGEPPETLFACADADHDVVLQGSAEGTLVLLSRSGSATSAQATSSWQLVREGYVNGQGGGYQSHVRLYDGTRHTILFEGANGALSDDPDHAYAGVATQNPDDPAQDFRFECAVDATNADVVSNLRKWAERTGGPAPEPEEGDAFDGWF